MDYKFFIKVLFLLNMLITQSLSVLETNANLDLVDARIRKNRVKREENQTLIAPQPQISNNTKIEISTSKSTEHNKSGM